MKKWSNPIRIAVFEHNQSLREAIIELLKTEQLFDVVAVYSNNVHCLDDLLKSKPDLLLMDIVSSGTNEIETVKTIKKHCSHVDILIQSFVEDEAQIQQSFIAGASGYILKRNLNDTLINSIKELRFGGSPKSHAIPLKILKMLKR